MTKIVDIHDQLEKKKKKEHLEKYRGRLDSIQKSSSALLAVFDAPCAALK